MNPNNKVAYCRVHFLEIFGGSTPMVVHFACPLDDSKYLEMHGRIVFFCLQSARNMLNGRVRK